MNLRIDNPEVARAVRDIAGLVQAAGGRAWLVGGCVRDALLERPVKDVDVEVYGMDPDRLRSVLETRFTLDLVGQSFAVFKLRGLPVDIALPRRELKTGEGHKGFAVQCDPGMPIREAAARRDFTINAMLYDPLEQRIEDPFNGRADLAARCLRHTSDRFREDPLRVLRGMQMVARFGLTPAPETIVISRTMTLEGLAPERIFGEWKKLLLLGEHIASGLEWLRSAGWLVHFPELETLVGCAQEPEWHPEGDVWVHTLGALDGFARMRTGDDGEDLVVGLAVLCHDFGKPATTRFEEGRLRSRGHEAAGEAPTRAFLGRMTNQEDLIRDVTALVTTHLRPRELFDGKAGDSAIRRLARQVQRIDRLVRVAHADRCGVDPAMAGTPYPACDWLLERARALEVVDSKPRPIVLGRHLIEQGMKPGPEMGRVLSALYEQQLDGKFSTVEEGLILVKELS